MSLIEENESTTEQTMTEQTIPQNDDAQDDDTAPTAEQLELQRNREIERTKVVATVGGKPVTIATLRTVFEAVENPDNWRGPLEVVVPVRMAELVEAAVEFYHGRKPKRTSTTKANVTLKSVGYVG